MKSLTLLAVILTLPFIAMSSTRDRLPTAAGTITIGGDGGWDYLVVDTTTHRLYVSHSSHVSVIDLEQGKPISDIPNTPSVHGIAIAPEVGRGFISDGADSAVTVFDLKTDSTITTIRVTGDNPDAILYDPVTRRVFTFNGRSGNATAIDAQTLRVVGTIALDGKPEYAVSDNQGAIYVNIENKSQVTRINPNDLTITARWPLAPCEDPTGMAIDRANHRLFVVGRNKLMAIMDADNGRIIKTLPIGAGVDGVVFDPSSWLIYSSNGEGTITIVREVSAEKFTVVGTLNTVRGARTIALDERTHRLYLPVGTRSSGTEPSNSDFRVLVYEP